MARKLLLPGFGGADLITLAGIASAGQPVVSDEYDLSRCDAWGIQVKSMTATDYDVDIDVHASLDGTNFKLITTLNSATVGSYLKFDASQAPHGIVRLSASVDDSEDSSDASFETDIVVQIVGFPKPITF